MQNPPEKKGLQRIFGKKDNQHEIILSHDYHQRQQDDTHARLKQLLADDSKNIGEMEKGQLWQYLNQDYALETKYQLDRKQLWFKSSGAQNQCRNNPGYYTALKNTNLVYPHPGPQDLEKDLVRSGVDKSRIGSL